MSIFSPQLSGLQKRRAPLVMSGFDADAAGFIAAAAITDPTQQTALDNLVVGLKTSGIWTKLAAVYPFVGGSSAAHKFNLKDARNSDDAFRLAFFGGWTHSGNGAQPDGTTAYADTFLNPATEVLSWNDNSFALYSRTAAAGGGGQYYEMGCGDNQGYKLTSLFVRRDNDGAAFDSGNFQSNRNAFANQDGSGFYLGSALSVPTLGIRSKFYRNGVLKGEIGLSASVTAPYNIYLGGFNEQNQNVYHSGKQIAFASIGAGLSDAEAADLNDLVQDFQTNLGRAV